MRASHKLATVGLGAMMGVGVAIAAPAGVASADQSAQQVINELRSQGYSITLDRVGSAPLNECVVTSVRNRRTAPIWGPNVYFGSNDDFNPFQDVTPTVTVSLNCSA
ncbi:hypothetical protein ACN27E_23820 [Mycobacterium sp. WMMD1722]|uniref:hypothetical protein n=1 Tax=Mycobacterium sp. WMMD1722 TaxID=3404117 RepID=UPI003BF4AD8D